MCDGSVVKLQHLFWRNALEPDCAAVGESCRLTINRLTDTKRPTVVPLEQAGLPRVVLTSQRLARSEYVEHGVIEAI